MFAVAALGGMEAKATDAVPTLLKALDDGEMIDHEPSVTVGMQATWALINIDPRAAATGIRDHPHVLSPVLNDLRAETPDVRVRGVRFLHDVICRLPGLEIEEAEPLLEGLLDDHYQNQNTGDLTIGELARIALSQMKRGKERRVE
jgi:hypothetical protein